MTDHEKASVLSWRGSDKYYNPYIGRGEVLFTGEIFVSPCLTDQNHLKQRIAFLPLSLHCRNARLYNLFISHIL